MVLGIRIQTKAGIPIYNKSWSSERLIGFETEDQTLQAGFMTAILSFAKSMQNKIGFIRFYPENDSIDERDHHLPGLDAMISIRDEIVFIVFLEPYIFKNHFELKIDWIYENVVKKYDKQIDLSEKIRFTPEDEIFIEDILFDKKAFEFINKKRKKIEKIIRKTLIKQFPHENILGFAICSFDNTILLTYLIEKDELEIYLNKMGLITKIKEWECQYKPIWIPDREPVLVSVINSAMQVPVIPTIKQDNLKIPYYYYLISDQNALLGPLKEKILYYINPFFLE
ncbi:MAG: hypothetical protein ACTSPY_10620 [Candidatus Helarchaeota archaeon]